MTLKWRRISPQMYESACGRFEIYRDPRGVATIYDEPWRLYWGKRCEQFRLLREAKARAQAAADLVRGPTKS